LILWVRAAVVNFCVVLWVGLRARLDELEISFASPEKRLRSG
jgi:hypothetical protein